MNVERRDVMSYVCVLEAHRGVPAAKFRNSNMRQAYHLIAFSNILVCVSVFLYSLQQHVVYCAMSRPQCKDGASL